MFTFISHFEKNKILQRQNCFVINSHWVSSRAVHISSRAVRVFPALSLRRIWPSYGTFFLMVFQGNCTWGRTGHMITILYFEFQKFCTHVMNIKRQRPFGMSAVHVTVFNQFNWIWKTLQNRSKNLQYYIHCFVSWKVESDFAASRAYLCWCS